MQPSRIRIGASQDHMDDHVPQMTGDPAYGRRARALAIGYRQGLRAAIEGAA